MSGKIGFLARVMAAQQHRAQPYVNEALSRLDDAVLADMGLDPSEVRSRRRRSSL